MDRPHKTRSSAKKLRTILSLILVLILYQVVHWGLSMEQKKRASIAILEIAAPQPPILIHPIEQPDNTKLFAVSTRYSEGTAVCRIEGKNIVVEPGFTAKGFLSNDLKIPIATIYPKDPTEQIDYSYEISGYAGVPGGHPDLQFVYKLPFPAKTSYTVTCGYGEGDHKDNFKYAVDFDMPEGSMICAARQGTVVAYQDTFNVGAPDQKFENFANYLMIKHDDGSYADYCHLKKNGLLVKLNEKVVAGQPIALSGNTGQSGGPHLHFAVYFIGGDEKRSTVPVIFATSSDTRRNFKSGQKLQN